MPGLLHSLFAANVKKYRNLRGITQAQLAEACDRTVKYIADVEFGRSFPSVGVIEDISKALSVKPFQLFYDETESIENSILHNALSRVEVRITDFVKQVISEHKNNN